MPESQPPVIVKAERLEAVVRAIFDALGSSRREGGLIARHVVEANLRGHDSHGVGMIPTYVRNARQGDMVLNAKLEIALDSGAVVICEGGRGVGQVMAHDCMDIGIARAREHGGCIIGLRNSHHMGRIGHWAEQCVAAGLASLHFVNVVSEPSVAPFGGTKPRLGTNPFAAGIPRPGREPVIVDFATSRWAVGKVRVAYNKGVPVPPGILLDSEGQPTTDPAALFRTPPGAVVTFGEHKGFGLELVCELFGAALTGGRVQSGPRDSDTVLNSMFAVIVSPERIGTADPFARSLEAVARWVQLETAEGGQEVLLPGDPERRSRESRLAEGIPVDPTTWEQILASAESAGLSRDDVEAMR